MSWQMRVLRPWLRWTARPVAARIRNWSIARRLFDIAAWVGFRRVKGAQFGAASEAGSGVYVTGPWAGDACVTLFLHGGAYLVGSPEAYKDLAAHISKVTCGPVYAPQYPLAPEHPAPAAYDAAMAAWDALVGQGWRPDQIVLCGDSAGGGLALSVLSGLLRKGVRPLCCIAFAPWTDLTLSGASLIRNAPRDVLLPAERIEEVRNLVLGRVPAEDPRVSPLFADFPDCPPVYIAYSETEILYDDACRMIRTLEDCGTSVRAEVQKDAPHVWQLFQGWLPEADASLRNVGEFVRESLRTSRQFGS